MLLCEHVFCVSLYPERRGHSTGMESEHDFQMQASTAVSLLSDVMEPCTASAVATKAVDICNNEPSPEILDTMIELAYR